jgi:hypothetical protein
MLLLLGYLLMSASPVSSRADMPVDAQVAHADMLHCCCEDILSHVPALLQAPQQRS